MDSAILVAGFLEPTVIVVGEACGRVDLAVAGSEEGGSVAADSAVDSVASLRR